LQKFDEFNQHVYDLLPERNKETRMVKASRWFGQQLDGRSIRDLVIAFQEALIDFFPRESQKETLAKIYQKIQELETIQGEMMIHQIDKNMEKAIPIMQQQIEKNMNPVLSGG
jgi:hypothetical protein